MHKAPELISGFFYLKHAGILSCRNARMLIRIIWGKKK